MQFVGLLLIVNSLVGGAWWIASGRPQLAVVPICVAALMAGVFLLRQDRAGEGAASGAKPSAAALEELAAETAKAKTLLADLQDQTAVADWHLKRLDEHLQGLLILPDGRTKIGDAVTGEATVLMSKLESLQKLVTDNPDGAWPLAQECVEIYESTREKTRTVPLVAGDVGPETIAWLYATAATCAQRAGDQEKTLSWARAAVEMRPTTERQFLLVTALINTNLQKEANALIQQQLKAGGAEATKFRQLLDRYKIAYKRAE